jgi:hypothetical protein
MYNAMQARGLAAEALICQLKKKLQKVKNYIFRIWHLVNNSAEN